VANRLFVAVIGERHSGKSKTWNTLFSRVTRTSSHPHLLKVSDGGSVEVFVISASNEEKKQYARDVLKDVNCRIVLCSVQNVEEGFKRTWNFVFDQEFDIYAQWLNPGFDNKERWDSLGLVNRLLHHGGVICIRNGRQGKWRLLSRVEEIRQFIHGWAAARDLLL
jgi:hypothetical protein